MRHNLVAVIYICIKVHRNVYHVRPMCRIQLCVVSKVWPFVVFMLILSNFHSCKPHDSVTALDVSMKYYSNLS